MKGTSWANSLYVLIRHSTNKKYNEEICEKILFFFCNVFDAPTNLLLKMFAVFSLHTKDQVHFFLKVAKIWTSSLRDSFVSTKNASLKKVYNNASIELTLPTFIRKTGAVTCALGIRTNFRCQRRRRTRSILRFFTWNLVLNTFAYSHPSAVN